jgi:hypothetical protein
MDDAELGAHAQSHGWSRVDTIPADDVLHRERLYQDVPVRGAWQWYDGPHRIVCGDVGQPHRRALYSVICIDDLDHLPDCDVRTELDANPHIWGNAITPDEGRWPRGVVDVLATRRDADRVRELIDVELVGLLATKPRWNLRIRGGRAVLQTSSPGKGLAAWDKRVQLVEAVLVREATAARIAADISRRRPARAPKRPSSPNGRTWTP